MTQTAPYSPDRSLKGKLRRRWARLVHQRRLLSMIDRPIVSISFDDAPVSAVESGAEVLEENGARGTYYVCAGLEGREGHMGRYADLDAYARLADRGHEIACHTFSHLDCGRANATAIAADVDANLAALVGGGLRARHFAYPYGDVSPAAKAALADRFASLRALHPGLVERGTDLNQLPAVGIEGVTGEATAEGWIRRAIKRKAWLILYTHDVRPDASDWGCTPEALDRLIRLATAGGAHVAPVGTVLEDLTRP